MKKIAIILLLVLLIASCSKGAVKNAQTQTPEPEDASVLPAVEQSTFASFDEIETVNTHKLGYIRDFLLENGKHVILVKKETGFVFLDGEYDEIIDPYISHGKSYKYDSEFSSRAFGFEAYPDHEYDSDYIAVKKDGVWGFISVADNGAEQIPCQYEAVHPFKEELAAVLVSGMWGFIDKKNEMVVRAQYTLVQDYFNGICIVEFEENGKEYIGAIDTQGTLKFKFEKNNQIKEIYDFYEENLAKAKGIKYETYAIDSDGNIVLENISDTGGRGGPEDPFFFFDENSGLCIQEYFDESVYAKQGKVSESKATFYGAFDKNGAWVIEPTIKTYDEATEANSRIIDGEDIVDGSAIGEKDGKEGFITPGGGTTVEYRYDSIRHLSGNCYLVTVNDKEGIVLPNNKIVVPIQYERIANYEKGFPVFVESDGRRGCIDAQGNWILTIAKDDEYEAFRNGIAFVYSEIKNEDEDEYSLLHTFRVRPYLPDGSELFPDIQLYELYEESGL